MSTPYNDLTNIINNIFQDADERNDFLERYSKILLCSKSENKDSILFSMPKSGLEIWYGEGSNGKTTLCQIFSILLDLPHVFCDNRDDTDFLSKNKNSVYISEEYQFELDVGEITTKYNEQIHLNDKIIIMPMNYIPDQNTSEHNLLITSFNSKFSLNPQKSELLSDCYILERIKKNKEEYKTALLNILFEYCNIGVLETYNYSGYGNNSDPNEPQILRLFTDKGILCFESINTSPDILCYLETSNFCKFKNHYGKKIKKVYVNKNLSSQNSKFVLSIVFESDENSDSSEFSIEVENINGTYDIYFE